MSTRRSLLNWSSMAIPSPAWDNRGHGDSSAKFDHYGDNATADDFLLVVKHLNKGPAVLIGNSFAAAAATIAAGRAAGRNSHEVAGIVLTGPVLRNPGSAAKMAMMKLLFVRPWGPAVWKSYAKTLWPGLGDQGAKERAAASTKSLTRPGRWTAFEATIAGLDHTAQVTPWLPSAKEVPTLVVMGDKDPDWTDPMEEARWVVSNFTNSRLVEASGAGHAPVLERSELAGKEIVGFLEALRSNKAFERP